MAFYFRAYSFLTIVILFSLLGNTCLANDREDAELLVGTWEQWLVPSVTFKNDGTFTRGIGGMIQGEWKVTNGKLVMIASILGLSESIVQKLDFVVTKYTLVWVEDRIKNTFTRK